MADLRKPPMSADLDSFVWKQWFNNVYTWIADINLAGGAVLSVTASAPLASSGGITPTISIASAIGPSLGGTGIASYTVGDILYASGTTTLAKLADVATGNALISGGVGAAPSWDKIGLTTHVSGTLPVANGGTGATDAATALSNLGGIATSGTPANNRIAVWASATSQDSSSDFLWDGTSLIVGQTATSSMAEVARIDGAVMSTIPSPGLPSTSDTVSGGPIGYRLWTGGSWAMDLGNNNGPGWIQVNTIHATVPSTGELLLNPRGGNVAVNSTSVSMSIFGSSASYALKVGGTIAATSPIYINASNASELHRDVTGGGTISSYQSVLQVGLHSTSNAQSITAGPSILFFGFDTSSPATKQFVGRFSGIFESNTASNVYGGIAVNVRTNHADSTAQTLAQTWYASTNTRIEGYTQLGGSGAPAVKMKKLTGTTNSSQGGTTSIAHGLTGSKIIGFTCKVDYSGDGRGMANAHTFFSGYHYDVYHDTTNFVVANHATNSGNILSKGIIITVWYEE